MEGAGCGHNAGYRTQTLATPAQGQQAMVLLQQEPISEGGAVEEEFRHFRNLMGWKAESYSVSEHNSRL